MTNLTAFRRDILRVLSTSAVPYSPQRLDRTLITAPHVFGRREGWDPGVVGGDLWPTLCELVRDGLVSDEHGYAITDAGRQALAAAETIPAVA